MNEMSLEQRIAFESRFLQQATTKGTTIPNRRDNSELADLSFSQERMWFMHQLSPEDPTYNMSWGARLKGRIHLPTLEQALAALVHRHHVLRTTYVEIEGSPQQRVHADPLMSLSIIDIRHAAPHGEHHLQCMLREAACEPFDLASEGPLRAKLYRLGEDDHILLFVGHHIALDGWACSILNTELNALYRQILAGGEPNLPEMSIQYADVAVWQRSKAGAGDSDDELSFWCDKLRGLPPALDLPISTIDSSQKSFHGDEIAFTLSEDTTRDLKRLAQGSMATPFMVLAAVVFSLLHRYTGESDIAIGTPVAGRMTEEEESLVGLFVNTIVLRGDLTAEPSLAEMIERVRTTCLEAYAHQTVPFERIVAALGGERTIDRSPIIQIMLAYRTFPVTPLTLPGTASEPLSVPAESAKLDLSFELWDTAEGMAGRMIYSTRRFHRDQMEALVAHFVRLLEAGLDQPSKCIAKLPMLGEDEHEQIVGNWNAATAEPPVSSLIHVMFEQAVHRYPDKLAVVYEGKSITYQQLNARANQIAAQLQKLGAGANRLIGISMHRSTDLIASLLGVLKSGAAYLPLDPSFPSQRIRYMMNDASVAAIITQPEVLERLPAHDVPALVLDEASFDQVGETTAIAANVTQDDLAYVMYTSGSTGNPKGVMVTHGNVTGFLSAFHEVVACGPDRISTNAITYAFDTSVEEIFGPLCYGGTLHIVPYETSLDGGSLAQFIVEHDIDTTYVVPDLLPGMAKTFRQNGGCGQLRCLRTGLAPKKQGTLQLLREAAPNLRIVNAYGPTEVTYGATAYEFTMASDPEQDVSIGVPFPNYQVYIVNNALQPVPIGVVGEILIGGVGVARGYLNRSELTAERFIQNPFSDSPDDRVYRTGDLARYQADGNIDFLGRRDNQVKIRGHRVELREIELALEAQAEVATCHARTYTLTTDDVRICAFIVLSQDGRFSEASCYRELQSRLPDFMVPSAIVVVPMLPLTATGKIDAGKLPPPIWGRHQHMTDDAGPQGTTELKLASIWEDVLQISDATRRSSFFELGGHSLLAIRLIARVQESFGVKIPIRKLFESPTIEALASFVDECRATHNSD